MLISDKFKFIFLHVPKNGGTSIADALKPCADVYNVDLVDKNIIESYGVDSSFLGTPIQHLPARELKKIVGDKKWNSYFKVAFVRNPFDRLVSHYFYLISDKSANSKNVKFLKFRDDVRGKDFSYFLRRINIPFSQYDFLQVDGSVAVDFIGRFENLEKDFAFFCDKVGLGSLKLPKLNTTRHKHYSNYYNAELIDLVQMQYQKDLEFFGYTFSEY